MTDERTVSAERAGTPAHLWIVGMLAVLWNAMGAFDYTATQLRLEFYMSQFTQEQLQYFYGFPAWFEAVWAVAVWGAVLGSLALLLRTRWAVALFGLSLLGVLISSIYNFGIREGASVMGTAGVVFGVVIALIAVLLTLYSYVLTRRGVLR